MGAEISWWGGHGTCELPLSTRPDAAPLVSNTSEQQLAQCDPRPIRHADQSCWLPWRNETGTVICVTPAETAAAIVADRFPNAIAGFLGGSATTYRRTSTSDLDIVVALKEGAEPFRETTTFDGWLVELFVHTEASFEYFWDLDAANRRPPLLRMCSEGIQLLSVDGAAERIRREASRRLQAGPRTLDEQEWAARRYALSDLLDDLCGSQHGPELVFIANAVLTATCEMALLAAGGWLGTGKWLARELEQVDAGLLQQLVSAHTGAVAGDGTAMLALAGQVLDRVGGPLSAGYYAGGPLPKG